MYNFGEIRYSNPRVYAVKKDDFTLCSAFDNGSNDREAALKRLNGSNLATSCANLVNFRPIISEFRPMLLKCAIFAAIQPQFDNKFHSSP